jgi:mono/diheme cytochrome c family protein
VRSSRWGSFALVAGALVVLVVAALGAGAVDMSMVRPSALERFIGPALRDASIRARAPRNVRAPTGPEVIAKGRDEYREHCQVCHGVPDGAQSSIAAGLSPSPPDLADPAIQARTDGELFFVISRGIRMTGMPAFGKSEPDDVRWALVAFVRQLPHLTPEQRSALAAEH